MKKMELPEFAYKCILFLLIIDAAIYNTTVNEVFKDSLHSFCLVGTIAFSILCILVRRYSIKRAISSCWYFVIGSDELYYKRKYRYVCEYIISCTCMETEYR